MRRPWNGRWVISRVMPRESARWTTSQRQPKSKGDGGLRKQSGNRLDNLLHQTPNPKLSTFQHNSTRCQTASSCLSRQRSIQNRQRICGIRYPKRGLHLQHRRKSYFHGKSERQNQHVYFPSRKNLPLHRNKKHSRVQHQVTQVQHSKGQQLRLRRTRHHDDHPSLKPCRKHYHNLPCRGESLRLRAMSSHGSREPVGQLESSRRRGLLALHLPPER